MSRAQAIAKMLENCKNYDKDYRHTGALDLCNEILNTSDTMDEATEKRICTAFIAHLTDESIEIKSNAVKCIQRVTTKIRESNLTIILNELAKNVVESSMETIDIFSLSIRGIINESQEERAPGIIHTLYPYLLKGIQQAKETNRKEECLDICTDLFKRYGLIILRQPGIVNKDTLMQAINQQLTDGATLNVRKRACYCMGAFAQILTSKQLATLSQILVDKIKKGQNKSEKVIHVQCLSLMAKSVGAKLSPYLQEVIPLLNQLIQKMDLQNSNDTDNDLTEACFTTIQSIIHKCPAEMKQYVPDLLKTAMSLSQYDPNYIYQDDDQVMASADEDEGWGSDFDDDNQDAEQDDDDTSWKVRRGAYRVINAVISTRADLHVDICKNQGSKLADRFKERVDDVKCDLLEAFKILVNVDEFGGNKRSDDEKKRQIQSISTEILTKLCKQASNKNQKVKIATLSCLAALGKCLQADLDKNFEVILPVIQAAVEDQDKFEPLIDSLKLLKTLFKSTEPGSQSNFLKYASQIQGFLLASLNHDYSRVVGAGLSVTGSFVTTLLKKDGSFNSEFKSLINPLYDAVYSKLCKHDIDQEVKQLSIIAAADLVSCCHSQLAAKQITDVVQVLVSRLTHELTRETALKGLTLIALSETSDRKGQKSAALAPLTGLGQHLPALLDLLNKSQRQLQLNTLECLEALTRRYKDQFKSNAAQIQQQIGDMISDNDLQRATLALRVATNIVATDSSPKNHTVVIKQAVAITQSELIQGACLTELQEFFRIAAASKIVDANAANTLLDIVTLKSQQSALCLAIVVNGDKAHANFEQTFIRLASDKVDTKKQIQGALCLGELGKLVDMSKTQVFQMLQDYFGSQNEQVRQAASISLGKITIGNPKFFLDKVFQLVTKSQAKQKYLFLNTLREIILNDSNCLKDYIQPMIELLMQQSTNEEESIRSIVAESLGRLFAAYPSELIAAVDNGLKTGDALKKSTIAKSVKYSGQKATENQHFKTIAVDLIKLKTETDPEVKKNALEGLTTIVHSNVQLVSELLGDMQMFAFAEVPIRKELIEEVDIGPFTQKYDKGTPIRRAAFQLLQTIFEVGATAADGVLKLVENIVQHGLMDTAEEVVVLSLQILARVTEMAAVHVVTKIDNIMQIFEKKLMLQYKQVTNQQSQERALNMIRAILRVIYLMESSTELQENPSAPFSEFVQKQVRSNATANEQYEKIKEQTQKIY